MRDAQYVSLLLLACLCFHHVPLARLASSPLGSSTTLATLCPYYIFIPLPDLVLAISNAPLTLRVVATAAKTGLNEGKWGQGRASAPFPWLAPYRTTGSPRTSCAKTNIKSILRMTKASLHITCGRLKPRRQASNVWQDIYVLSRRTPWRLLEYLDPAAYSWLHWLFLVLVSSPPSADLLAWNVGETSRRD